MTGGSNGRRVIISWRDASQGVSSLAVIMTTGCVSLFLSGVLDCGSLGDAIVVGLPDDVGVCGEFEETFDGFSKEVLVSDVIGIEATPAERAALHLPNFNISSAVNLRPYGEHVLSTPHAKDSSANLFTCFCELIPNHDQ